MSKKFYAVNRETGERWQPDNHLQEEFLVMYDSGYLAVVTGTKWSAPSVRSLDPKKWKTVVKTELFKQE